VTKNFLPNVIARLIDDDVRHVCPMAMHRQFRQLRPLLARELGKGRPYVILLQSRKPLFTSHDFGP
jgi:hypothetical protein